MVCMMISLASPSFAAERKKNVASVYITSDNPSRYGRTWIEGDKERKATGSVRVVSDSGRVIYEGKLKQIKGRGNSTWGDPKKPYQIKLDQAFDLCETGLQDEANKTWVLLSGYKDCSLMRNQVTFAIADAIGMNYTPNCRQVELYYDNQYRGMYLLSEKTEVGKGRVDVTDLEKEIEKANPGLSPDQQPVKIGKTDKGLKCQTVGNLTMPGRNGGYLLEMDYEVRAVEEASWFETKKQQYVVVKSPEYLPQSGMNYISGLYQTMENAVYNGGVDPETGKDYRELVDVESLAKMYLIEELSQDVDAFKSSLYFYKPEGEEKLYAGPVWDFDLGYGDVATYGKRACPYGFQAGQQELPLRLLMIPSFQEEVKRVYSELLYEAVKSMPEQMWICASNCRNAYSRNSALWPENTSGDGSEAVKDLEEFLLERNEFLYKEIMQWDGSRVNYLGSFVDVRMSDWYYEDIRYAARNDLMKGMERNRFYPQKSMDRAMVITVLYRVAGRPAVHSENTFTDVPSDMWYTKAISWAQENGIAYGVGDGRFNLNENVTRQDFVTLLYRYKGSPAAETDLSSFHDAEEVSDYACDAFKWAIENGIIRGNDKNVLMPSENLTRAQAAAIIRRLKEN